MNPTGATPVGATIPETAVSEPAPTVHGRLMAAADGFEGKLGNALDRAPAHHQRDRRGMTLERIEKAPQGHAHAEVEHLLLDQITHPGRLHRYDFAKFLGL